MTETSELTSLGTFAGTNGDTSFFHMVKLNDNDIIMLVDDDTDQPYENANGPINVDWGARDQ